MSSNHQRPAVLCLLVAFPLAATAAGLEDEGADWPQWRGPDKTGVSPETGWSPVGAENVLWARNIGFGHSSFSIAGGKLFTMGYDLERKLDVVHCLDPETGEEQWTHTYPAEYWNEGHDGGTCTTPTVDGKVVFTSNREGNLFALRADTGSVIWQKDVQEELGVTPPRWGFSGSPLVVGDTLIANVDKIAAFDKATGATKWTTEKAYGNAYSTPIEYDYNGRPALLALNGEGLAVIDRTDGSEITFHPWTLSAEQAIFGATPILTGDGRIFISGTAGGGCQMLQPGDDGLEVVWESRVMANQLAGGALYEGHIYGFDRAVLKCIDLEGNEKWRQRGIGLGAMSVVGGRLLILGAKGEVIVAEANPEKYVELSREKVLDGGAYWATPVLSHGLAYARNSLGDMVCLDYRSSEDMSAATRELAQGELPAARDLLAAHVEAMGGADALRGLSAAAFTGAGEQHGGGPIEHCDATVAWAADGSFVWRFSTGFEFGFTPEFGWILSPQGANVLDEGRIANLREACDLHRFLADNWGYESLETVEARVFDDRPCYLVKATKPDGAERTLYFEIESGLLAGQEGEDTSLWVFDDYRPAAGVMLPMSWSSFAPGSGSMTLADLSNVSLDEIDRSVFEPPLAVRLTTMSPEEQEQRNAALRAKYEELTGDYKLGTGSLAGTPISILINEGGLQLSFGGQQPGYLSEPDEQGRMFDLTNNQIYIQIDRDESGALQGLRVFAYGDEFGKLARVEE